MRFFLLALMGGLIFGQERWVSHITSSSGGFESLILITNTGTTSASYQIQPFTVSGSTSAVKSGTVQPGAYVLSSAPSFFGNSSISHFFIGSSTSEKISVQVMYRRLSGGVAANVLEGGTSKGWKVFSGDWSYGWDGLAIVNSGTTSSQITVKQRDSAGNQVGSTLTTDLAAKAKFLYVLANSFNGSRYFYEISGTNELAVTALRGDIANTVLAGNPSIPFTFQGEAQTGNQYEDEVLLLKGHWYLTYLIGSSSFNQDYKFTSIYDGQLSSEGAPYIQGTDQYGDLVLGTYIPSIGVWFIFDQGITLDRVFTFKTTGSTVQPPACYYQVTPSGSTNLGTCWALSGYKTTTKVDWISSDNEQAELGAAVGLESIWKHDPHFLTELEHSKAVLGVVRSD